MFYKKGLNISHAKDMWNFLKDHYTYDTMNSWNKLKSIAHNVKAYNLPFRNRYEDVLVALEESRYDLINDEIKEWEAEHGYCYEVFFNGRSGGYLVLTKKNNNGNVLSSIITDYDTYEDFKQDNIVSDYMEDLRYYTQLVQSFDKLCDHLVEVADDVCDQMLEEEAEEERRETLGKPFKTIKCDETYEYDSKEDGRLHEKYMNIKGYNVIDRHYRNGKFYFTYGIRDLIKDSVIDE